MSCVFDRRSGAVPQGVPRRHRWRPQVAATCILSALLLCGPARSETAGPAEAPDPDVFQLEPPFTPEPNPLPPHTGDMILGDLSGSAGWALPFGLDVGVGLTGPDPIGVLLGGEASLVYLYRMTLWAGALAAGRYDFGTEHAYGTLALEAGYSVVGVEAGVDVRDDGEVGGRFRVFFGVASGWYAGVDTVDGARVHLGLLIKYPLLLD